MQLMCKHAYHNRIKWQNFNFSSIYIHRAKFFANLNGVLWFRRKQTFQDILNLCLGVTKLTLCSNAWAYTKITSHKNVDFFIVLFPCVQIWRFSLCCTVHKSISKCFNDPQHVDDLLAGIIFELNYGRDLN